MLTGYLRETERLCLSAYSRHPFRNDKHLAFRIVHLDTGTRVLHPRLAGIYSEP